MYSPTLNLHIKIHIPTHEDTISYPHWSSHVWLDRTVARGPPSPISTARSGSMAPDHPTLLGGRMLILSVPFDPALCIVNGIVQRTALFYPCTTIHRRYMHAWAHDDANRVSAPPLWQAVQCISTGTLRTSRKVCIGLMHSQLHLQCGSMSTMDSRWGAYCPVNMACGDVVPGATHSKQVIVHMYICKCNMSLIINIHTIYILEMRGNTRHRKVYIYNKSKSYWPRDFQYQKHKGKDTA